MANDETPREDSFQVTLPSNACLETFPTNQANSFKIKFMKPIRCIPASDWEFALMDMQIPRNWPNLLQDSKLLLFVEVAHTKDTAISHPNPPKSFSRDKHNHFHNSAANEELLLSVNEALYLDTYFADDWIFVTVIDVPRGHYASLTELGLYIEKAFKKLLTPLTVLYKTQDLGIKFSLDHITGTISFEGVGENFRYWLSATDKYLLETRFHFQESHVTTRRNDAESQILHPKISSYELPQKSIAPAELEQMSSVYVYSDIAQYQLIGGNTTQLLAVIPIETAEEERRARGQQHFFIANPPYYMPVPRGEIEMIHIQLNTDWGDPFPFEQTGNTKVRCRLHFRKRNPVARQLFI